MVFAISMGMADRGAELSKLSQYPFEREVLFAPLTGLEVVESCAITLSTEPRR